VWGDDVAIGDDNDPTTFGRPFFSSANLLLNCLFYQDLLAKGVKLVPHIDRSDLLHYTTHTVLPHRDRLRRGAE
jgi:hypothetical protein